MSIRLALLALLAERPMHGYLLRQEFEARTGATWPLNIGQVYTTLGRLQRDGLVDEEGHGDDGSVVYRLTDDGRGVVGAWWYRPVERDAPARDELAIKIALAVTAPQVDPRAVIHAQRVESLRSLQEYTRLKAAIPEPPPEAELAWLLVLDSLVFAAEAEVRWLDHIEQRLARSAPSGASGPSGPSAAATQATPAPQTDGTTHADRSTQADRPTPTTAIDLPAAERSVR